jgi:thiosulfate/3-mercaptopyruvate sulfurtransferase
VERLVSTEWLAKELGAPDLRVIDVRLQFHYRDEGGFELKSGRELWEQGHVPTAVYLDIPAELADPAASVPLMLPPAEQFAAAMGRVGVGTGTRVVIYGTDNHMWAARLWWMLRAYGFDDAALLDGGWDAWVADGHPVTTDATTPPPARFDAQYRPGLFVTKDEVRAAIEDDRVAIVDALSPEAFSGQRHDYARQGHIAGACNVPMGSLVDPATGRYLPREQLEAAFGKVSGADRVITYCGGGVAASSDAFVLSMLGVDNVAVYDGSLLEWAADPSLPMETGAG